jgi:hypothetical protein
MGGVKAPGAHWVGREMWVLCVCVMDLMTMLSIFKTYIAFVKVIFVVYVLFDLMVSVHECTVDLYEISNDENRAG